MLWVIIPKTLKAKVKSGYNAKKLQGCFIICNALAYAEIFLADGNLNDWRQEIVVLLMQTATKSIEHNSVITFAQGKGQRE